MPQLESRTQEQWRDGLYDELIARQPAIARRRRYYEGQHPLISPPDRTSNEFQRLAVLGQANLSANIVDTVVDRLQITGLRGDVQVWEALRANYIPAEADTVHEEAVKVGRAFVLVWPSDESPVGVDITPEDPGEMIVGYEPGRRHEAAAALKVFRYEDREYATLWLPKVVRFWQRHVTAPAVSPAQSQTDRPTEVPIKEQADWEPWAGPGDDGDGDNPLGTIPVVEFPSRRKLYGPVSPELSETVLRTQDRINKTMFDLVVTSEYMAFPQRVTIGIEQQYDANTGEPVNPLKSGPNRVWELLADDPSKAQVFQLTAADLTNLIRFIEADLRLLAAQSRTPMYALAGDLVNIGAETVTALDAALIAKSKRHARNLDGRWARVGQLTAAAIGRREVGDVESALALEVVWNDFELFTFNQRADAVIKLRAAGYPFSAIARKMGESPEEIPRLQAERDAEGQTPGPQTTRAEMATAADRALTPG